MTTQARKRLFIFSIIAAPLVLLICFMVFRETPPPPAPPLPNPNGYDILLKAGNMITGEVWNYDEATEGELRAIVQTNAAALALATIGLTNPCAVTLQYSQAYPSNHMQDFAALRNVAQVFTAKGNLAAKENHYAAAAESYLDVVHLSNQMRCGGLMIDAMIGMGVEALGVKHLQTLVDHLNSKSCRETAAALETLNAQTPIWAEITRQERDWSRRTFSGFGYALERLMGRKFSEPIPNAEQNYEGEQNEARQLLIDLASHAYELDKGHRPTDIGDLVPDYLKSVPQNLPVGGNPH